MFKGGVLLRSGLLLAVVVPAWQAHAEGQVINVTGVAVLDRGTESLQVQRGLAVVEMDRVRTDDSSSLALHMADDALLSVGSNSAVEVTEYRRPGFGGSRTDDPGTATYTLNAGSVRVLTGLISQLDPQAHRVVTEHATLIATGTDLSTILCDAECAAEHGMQRGQYVSVIVGSVNVSNDQGEHAAGAGACVFVTSGAAPVAADPSACLAMRLPELRDPHRRDPDPPPRDDGPPPVPPVDPPPPEPPVSP